VAAGLASTSRQIGQTLGVAVIGAVVTSHTHGSVRIGLAAASHTGWWILAGCSAAVCVLGASGTSRRALETARRTAVDLNPDVLVPARVGAP
jgi:hypothetical protein